jgi:hypothetical protein
VNKRILEALLFPKEPHVRNEDPGPYSSYRSYKPHLQREFRRKCVYCCASDGPVGDDVFGVDHYLPKSKFPQFAQEWKNLFYACGRCNTLKSDFVSTPDLYLPNPCQHTMADHLQYEEADIVARTQHGRYMSELLRLGEQGRRKRRDLTLAVLRDFLVNRNDLLRELTFYESMVDKGEGDRETLKALIQEAAEELERVNGRIELLTGEPVGSAAADRRTL